MNKNSYFVTYLNVNMTHSQQEIESGRLYCFKYSEFR